MNELISVVIPIYNVENYLEACLDSVLDQTFFNLEIILVNDGSTDSSLQICQKYVTKDNRVQLLNKQNGGLSDARNWGMAVASGKYITFVDSDDVIDKTLFEYLLELIFYNNADISICDPLHCYINEPIVFTKGSNVVVYSKENAIEEMLYQNSFLVTAWGKLYKRELFRNISFPKGKLFEDSAIMYRVFDCANNIVYSNAKLYGYMHRENSITTRKFDKRDCDIVEIADVIVDYFSNRSFNLQKATLSYQTSAALRVVLNAPKDNDYKTIISNCKKTISKNYKTNMHDKRIRKKLRVALILYKYFNSIIPVIYKRVDRWK